MSTKKSVINPASGGGEQDRPGGVFQDGGAELPLHQGGRVQRDLRNCGVRMIEKIGSIFYPTWRAGFDGNVMGVGGVSQTVTTRNGGGTY